MENRRGCRGNLKKSFSEGKIRMTYVYEIRNLITGEMYVGKTIHLAERRRKHMTHSDVKKVSDSVSKYGVENHSFTVVWSGKVSDSVSYIAEMVHMNQYKGNPLCMNQQFYGGVGMLSSKWYSMEEKRKIEKDKAILKENQEKISIERKARRKLAKESDKKVDKKVRRGSQWFNDGSGRRPWKRL